MPSWTETPKHRTSTNPWVYGKTRSATDSHIKKTFTRNGHHNESRFRHLHSDWFSPRHRAGTARAESLWTPDQALLPMKIIVLPEPIKSGIFHHPFPAVTRKHRGTQRQRRSNFGFFYISGLNSKEKRKIRLKRVRKQMDSGLPQTLLKSIEVYGQAVPKWSEFLSTDQGRHELPKAIRRADRLRLYFSELARTQWNKTSTPLLSILRELCVH